MKPLPPLAPLFALLLTLPACKEAGNPPATPEAKKPADPAPAVPKPTADPAPAPAPPSAASPAVSAASGWAAYRGTQGDGKSPESLAKKAVPTEAAWKVTTETGFSSIAVSGGKAYTLVTREIDGNPTEICVAYDAASGKEAWTAGLGLGQKYGHDGGNSGTPDNSGGDGPRSTPVVSGDKVFVLDSHLKLFALNAADGKEAWAVDLVASHGGKNIKWLNAASPVVDGDRVFVAGGGASQSLLAFNKDTGTVIWKSESDGITHATPVMADLGGVRQVIFFTQNGLVAARAENGKVLWRQKFPFNVSTAASPVVFEDIVFCSAGYNVGGGAYRVGKTGEDFAVTEIWRTENDNINHWSTPLVKDGYLYGMFGFKEYGACPLACVDIRTGEKKWSQPGFGPGNVILSGDGTLIALSDKGEVVLAEAKPDAYTELSRADVLDGKCWSTPALADGHVFVRSTSQAAALKFGN